jgi:hypothetical protein
VKALAIRSTRLFLPALLCLLSAVSCKCGEPGTSTRGPCEGIANVEPNNFDSCTADSQCRDQFLCTAQKDREGLSCCVGSSRKCSNEGDCCAGQTCAADQGRCVDKAQECADDAACGGEGRYCLPWTNLLGRTVKRCQFKPCSGLGECDPGLTCFKGECLGALPCGGSCEAGKACLAKADYCQAYACPASCAPGFIATFKDPQNSWDYCLKPQIACECAELPPLSSNDFGRFSAIATEPSNGELWVSAYDGQFGDLAVNRYDPAGKLTKQEYLDGVPSGGKAKWAPSGPRGGVEEPGPDVGRYSDIAFSGARAFISYYDVTSGDLKLAKRQADGRWSTLTVDGASADVGLYTSIAVDPDGMVAIAYHQRGGAADFNLSSCPSPIPTGDKANITALKIARAKTLDPSPADFTVTTLACEARPPAACSGCSQVCADPAGAAPAGCYAGTSGCTSCGSGELCVTVGTTATCAKKFTPSTLQEIPDGVGLFPSLAFKGKDAYVVYMRRQGQDGNLVGVSLSAAGVRSALTLLDADGDTGYFPDLKIKPDTQEIWVSYFSGSSGALKLFKGTTFSAGAPTVIDSGSGGPGSGEVALVGADSSLVFAPNNQVLVVYQDSTRSDLKMALWRQSGWEKLKPLRSEGAVGFFADAAVTQGSIFVSHAQIRAKLVGGNPTVANGLVLDKFTPP